MSILTKIHLEETGISEEMGMEESTNDLEEGYWLRIHYPRGVSQDYCIFQVDNATPYEELITKTVDIHEFAQWFDFFGQMRGIDDVMDFIGVECLRETEKSLYIDMDLQHKLRQEYLDICRANGGILISTEQSEEECFKQVKKAVMEGLRKRGGALL